METLHLLSWNFRTHQRGVFESVHARVTSMQEGLSRLSERFSFRELAVLVTCNRVEIIFTASPRESSWLCAEVERFLLPEGVRSPENQALHFHGFDALHWLCRVASGLESMAIGEPQILGQVREAYKTAITAGTAGKVLHRAFQTSLRTARNARCESGIGAGRVGLSSLAVSALAQHIREHGLKGDIVLIGAGGMAEAVVEEARRAGLRIAMVVNRGAERGQALARQAGAVYMPLNDWLASPHVADGVIGAISGGEIIPCDTLARRRRNLLPLMVVDLGLPGNFGEPKGSVSPVKYCGIFHLERIAAGHRLRREQAAQHASAVVCDSIDEVRRRDHIRAKADLIATLRAHFDAAWEAEYRRITASPAFPGDEAARRTLSRDLRSAYNKLKHEQTIAIRAALVSGGRSSTGDRVHPLDIIREFDSRIAASLPSPVKQAS
ncbi:MAG: Glutamyl-tRNA reductase [Myxococcota bacterium]|nr:Glutamyl-tRNA reductase [Myxococcota bacterium]